MLPQCLSNYTACAFRTYYNMFKITGQRLLCARVTFISLIVCTVFLDLLLQLVFTTLRFYRNQYFGASLWIRFNQNLKAALLQGFFKWRDHHFYWFKCFSNTKTIYRKGFSCQYVKLTALLYAYTNYRLKCI